MHIKHVNVNLPSAWYSGAVLAPEAKSLLVSVMFLIPPWLPACLVLGMGLINVCGTELRCINLSSRPLLKCPKSSLFQILWWEGQRGEPFSCVSGITSNQVSISKSVIRGLQSRCSDPFLPFILNQVLLKAFWGL